MSPGRLRERERERAVAPWIRTRLRTAPWAAVAFGALVLVTAFLAAALPRAVDAYETRGLRQDIAGAPPGRTVLELTAPQPGFGMSQSEREEAVRPAVLTAVHHQVLATLPEPVRADARQSSYGVRTVETVTGTDPWLPRPDAVPPEFTLAAQADLAAHATVRKGRLPAARSEVTAATKELEGAATVATARSLRLDVGSVVHFGGKAGGTPLAVRITGIVEPGQPEAGYWSAEPVLRTPGLAALPTTPPMQYWRAALLLPPEAAPALLGTLTEPQLYWRLAPDPGSLTVRDVPALTERIASLENGPELLRLREFAGETTALTTGLETVLASYTSMREAIAPVVAVAAIGIGAVAAVVLAMTGGLVTGRRSAELALLRSRGGSLKGIGGRLLGESAVIALPAAAAGVLLAVAAVAEARLLPAVLGGAAVAVLACAVLPLWAIVRHRRPRAQGGRDDLADARPGRRRTVAELTLLVLSVGAVVALRRRGTSGAGSGDYLVSAAPVLVGLIAALVLVRLYPLPLRWAARPARRLRGAVGFLSLARAGRSSATGALPLLALLIALTTAAFGGSVLAGVSDARDRAALLATGADARISAPGDLAALPEGMDRAVRGTAGVADVTAVRIERNTDLASGGSVTLVGVEPESYARLAGELALGAFPADALKAPEGAGGVLNAVASPGVAERLGTAPRRIRTLAGDITVRIAAVRPRTPAVPDAGFLLVDRGGLPERAAPTTLLAAGAALDAQALRAAVRDAGEEFSVRLRSEERSAFRDSPLQSGAERIYSAAIAAGAGYAVLALLLSLLQSGPERTMLLARLRTMGLTTRQSRRLLGLEALPQALLAATGGVLVGWATIRLLAPGVDLARLALDAAPGIGPVDGAEGASLRADVWSLTVPALGVVALAGAVAAGQAWWAGRRGSITELRAGDMR